LRLLAGVISASARRAISCSASPLRLVYLLPEYLVATQGFDSSRSARLWLDRAAAIAADPLVPLLMKRIDARLLVGFGLVVFAAAVL